MTIRTFLILHLLAFSFSAVCQDKLTDKDGPAYKYRCGDFRLIPLKEKQSFSFPLDAIEVADMRQDTTKFGYFPSASSGITLKFCFEKNAAAEIAAFLNSSLFLKPPLGGQKLLYCLKKLWIVSADTTDMRRPRPFLTRSRLYFKAELFLEKDSCYYPLYRYDSVFMYEKAPNSFSIKWVEESLLKSLKPLENLLPEKIVKRSCIHQAEMNSYYADEKQTAIDTAAPKRGVYLTVEQFKNNRPAYTDFEIVFDDLVDNMQIKDKDGNTTFLSKDWGFCDGKQFYMRMGSNYFRLFKTGGTYDLYGTSRMDMKTRYRSPVITGPGIPPGGTIITAVIAEALKTGKSRLGKLKPLQLDMETGMVY